MMLHELAEKFSRLLALNGKPTRYKGKLVVNTNVKYRTHVSEGSGALGAVGPVSAEFVESAAAHMEAMLIMTESVSPSEMVTISLSRRELNHFVAYMRCLDETFRSQEAELQTYHENEKRDFERKIMQKASEAGQAARQFTATEYQIRASEYKRRLECLGQQFAAPPVFRDNESYRALAEKAGAYRSKKEK